MDTLKIAILGGGNLGNSLANGFLTTGQVPASSLTVTRRKAHLLRPLGDQGVNVTSDNTEAVKQSDIIIISVKPQQMEALLKEIQPVLNPAKHIIVSTVTGFTMKRMKSFTGDVAVFRVMPNTAVAIHESMSCLSGNQPDEKAQEKVLSLFNLLGRTMMVSEELMEASTVLAACGIAFALRFLRAMTQGGIEIGFHSEIAQLIAAQTLRGATGLVLEGGQHPEEEIDKVTTPMGITISGLNEMEHNGFSSALIKGIVTSFNKIAALPH